MKNSTCHITHKYLLTENLWKGRTSQTALWRCVRKKKIFRKTLGFLACRTEMDVRSALNMKAPFHQADCHLPTHLTSLISTHSLPLYIWIPRRYLFYSPFLSTGVSTLKVSSLLGWCCTTWATPPAIDNALLFSSFPHKFPFSFPIPTHP
jgi:hypothetical protein